MAWIKQDDIKTANVMPCGICGAPGHFMKWGGYACEANEHHVAAGQTGIWTDLMPSAESYKKDSVGGKVMKHSVEKMLTFTSDMHMGGNNVFPTWEELKKMVEKATEPAMIKFPVIDSMDYISIIKEKSLPDKISIPPEIMEQFKATMKKWVFTPKLDGVSQDVMDDVKASMEGIVFKAHSPYSVDDGGVFVKEKAGEAAKGLAKAMLGTDEQVMTPELYEKIYGHPYVAVPAPKKKKSKALPVGVPTVFPPLLSNPRSKWGQKMKEKLEGKS